MAQLDLSRAALRLDAMELKAGLELLRGESSMTAQLEALAAAGVLQRGALDAVARRLLEVVGEPKLRLVVERFVDEAPVVEEAWAAEHLAVWGSVLDGDLELTALEPSLLPWQVMRVVGLGPREHVEAPQELRLPTACLDGACRALVDGGRSAAERVLEAEPGMDDASRSRLVDMLVERRSSWRASSTWVGAEGERRDVTVSIFDGGRMGLWESEASKDGMSIQLRAITPGAVWKCLTGLVPPVQVSPHESTPPPHAA